MPDGCTVHGVAAERVAELWPVADDRVGTHVGLCLCCKGPAPMIRHAWAFGDFVGLPLCKACSEGAETVDEIGVVLGALYPGGGLGSS